MPRASFLAAHFQAPRALGDLAWRSALDALFPPRCGGCGRFSRALFCGFCVRRVQVIQGPGCEVCGRLFDPLAKGAPICALCRALEPPYARARAAWAFDGPVREAIHRYKYQRRFALAPRLARAMIGAPGAQTMLNQWRPQWLVPVPLHPSRGRARGFNQSALLARELSKICGIETLDLLRRVRRTPPQVGLSGQARQRNVRGAFAMDERLWEGKGGARLLLLDDVFTTGSTLAECAATLVEAGAIRSRRFNGGAPAQTRRSARGRKRLAVGAPGTVLGEAQGAGLPPSSNPEAANLPVR